VQRAFILWFRSDESTNLEQLNHLLSDGWVVVSASPMSGTGDTRLPDGFYPYSRSLVVLSKSDGVA
jgi:hypothetical protein